MTDITQREAIPTGCLAPMEYRGRAIPVAVAMELPWPPSKNTYWRAWKHRVIVSRLGNAFKKEAAVRIRETLTVSSSGRYSLKAGRLVLTDDGLVRVADGLRACMRLLVHAPNRAKRDVSNYIGAAQDAVQAAGIIVDDEIIDYCEIVRHSPNTGDGYARVEIAIIPTDLKVGPCWCREGEE